MKLVFLGPPGAGKGTISHGVTERLGIVQVSTGDMLRAAIAADTELGRQAKRRINQGHLVPDELVIGIFKNRIAKPDCGNGYILDGFPRTIPQAEALEQTGVELDCVVNFVVPDDVIIARLSGRRVDRRTGKSYSVNPGGAPQPPPDIDPDDLILRDDDKPEAVAARLRIYRQQTAPLVGFYRERHLLRDINVDRSVDAIIEDLVHMLGA